jgi:hypothetical protein
MRGVLATSLVALLLAAPAAAHVTVAPPFVSAGGTAILTLAAPNERDEPMTQLTATVPRGFEIIGASSVNGWRADVDGATARWLGGSLPPGAEAKFALEVEASATPGPVVLEAVQIYPGGERVRWPVALTVLPAANDSSQGLRWGWVALIAGILLALAVVAVAWRRRGRALQER